MSTDPHAATEAPGSRMVVLTRRADFVAASRERRQSRPGLILQARRRRPGEPAAAAVRVGYTCSRKVGNAVARNRAKRRLRAAARAVLARNGRSGWDYVLVGRHSATAARPFDALCDDLADALRAVHGGPQ